MTASGPPPVSQLVVQDLTRAAIFLVVTINPGMTNKAAVRSFCNGLPGLVRAVGFRDIEGNLSCVMGFGSDAWDRLFGQPRPAELHPFREIRAGPRHAVATPGDLLFHIRAKRMDLCFELATQIMARLGRCGLAGRRSAWLSLLRRPRSAWASSTGRKIRAARPRSMPPISATRTPPSPAAATSSCRNTCTTWPAGMRCPPRPRNASSAAPSFPISNSTIRSSRPRRTTR